MFDGFDEAIRRADQDYERRRQLFEKLSLDPPRAADVGERVLVAASLVGRGYEWARLEAEVLEVADTAYRVRYTTYKLAGKPVEEWVHRLVVTDVIGANVVS